MIAKMRELWVEDFMGKARIRADGKVVRDMHIFQVKAPSESTGEWDVLKQVSTIAAEDAALPLSASECPHARAGQAGQSVQ